MNMAAPRGGRAALSRAALPVLVAAGCGARSPSPQAAARRSPPPIKRYARQPPGKPGRLFCGSPCRARPKGPLPAPGAAARPSRPIAAAPRAGRIAMRPRWPGGHNAPARAAGQPLDKAPAVKSAAGGAGWPACAHPAGAPAARLSPGAPLPLAGACPWVVGRSSSARGARGPASGAPGA